MTIGDLRRLVSAATIAALGTLAAAGPCPAQCEATESVELSWPDVFSQDHFGNAVAIAGDVAVVGAHLDGDGGEDHGAAYVYRFDGFRWTLEAELTASDRAPGDELGKSVAVSGDVVVAGANFEDQGGMDSGAAYVFEHDGAGWHEVAKLTLAGAMEYDNFGISAAMDGDVIVIGANLDDTTQVNTGAAHVFVRPQDGWASMTQTATLTASDAAFSAELGLSVAIDGDVVVVGTQFDTAGGTGAGAAYVFVRPPGGWADATENAKLTASAPAEQDRFGHSVSVSGETIVVGAWGDDEVADKSGSAYVFERPPGGWADMTETGKLTASDARPSQHLGWSVSASGDVIVAGAPDNLFDGAGNGTAYVFLRPAGGWADGHEAARVTASNGGGDDQFAQAVAVADGVAVLGAWYHDTDRRDRSGAAYVVHGLADCQPNGSLDLCDVVGGDSPDADGNALPDECQGAGDVDLLQVAKAAGTDLSLAWSASCLAADHDHAVYEGALGDFTSHAVVSCTTAGALEAMIMPAALGRYYVVVPSNAVSEGSYGRDSFGFERPPASEACLPQVLGGCP